MTIRVESYVSKPGWHQDVFRRVQTRTWPRSAVTIDLRRPSCWPSNSIAFHRGRSMSVDNFQGRQGPRHPQRNPLPRGCRLETPGVKNHKEQKRTAAQQNLIESTLTPPSGCPKNWGHLTPMSHGDRPSPDTPTECWADPVDPRKESNDKHDILLV